MEDVPSTLWIFGYGSLVWNPGFPHTDARVGRIKGFSRRFWQGNAVQRGTKEQPGRVATLVDDPEEVTWGKAFELSDESCVSALDYLNTRESKLGGYATRLVTFEPIDARETPFPVLVYVATADNEFYLGPAPLHEVASQIARCRGVNGHNAEYLLRLAEFMHEHVPFAADDHLFSLESLVRQRLKEAKVSIPSVMGDAVEAREPEARPQAAEARPNNFQFTATLPAKNLRCLKV